MSRSRVNANWIDQLANVGFISHDITKVPVLLALDRNGAVAQALTLESALSTDGNLPFALDH
ncbi:hypothetical protein HH219_01385 [Pseudoalteromonas sp. NEC-BIFX-2020_015]|uniref:hypothetical protein n=1 Tax=Pseudoalteromonas sp. NEC-BIFX-2020_015 TaxID=2729544 RepID=UPI0014613DBA|nr:hypothetical protein [Pseudoalteromonas sp. NEC-BIFX-2020_015]NMR24210.1 hypothetical protein [Pseudoalteromonas sp. NEC-BIFX-2020_015]